MSRAPDMRVPVTFSSGWSRWSAMAIFTAIVAGGVVPLQPSPWAAAVAAVVAIGAGAAIVWGRPRVLRLPAAALATAGIVVLGHADSADLCWFAICMIGIWCALTGTRRDALAYLAGALVLFAVEWIWVHPDPGWGAWIGGTALAVGAGLVVRHDRTLVAQLEEAQAGLADRARAEERNRIARELHDVIAHTLTVSLLHVTSARLAVEHGLDDAAKSLAEAERLGRASLDEVRAAVGMLHHDGDGRAGPTAPLPGAAELPALVEQFRSAGVRADLVVEGDAGRLPATTGLALYRILQEALTNAIKHAPGARTQVRLAVGPAEVQLSVDTAGRPAARAGNGAGGFGVLNMHERAESLGGSCRAGPGGGGWLVQATIPLDSRGRIEQAR